MTHMKKLRLAILMLCCLIPILSAAAGADVTLTITSSFAGSDAASVAYAELLKEFENQTGYTVEDHSAPSDEAWKAGVLNDFAAGNEPDVLFFFANSADSAPLLRRVVPVHEILAAYPELDLTEHESLRERDGQVYAIPVRPYFEGLFVNTDLFEMMDIPLPSTWEDLMAAVGRFREKDIVPIAVSLSDIPHYLAEFAMLSCCSAEEYSLRPETLEEVPESWYKAMSLIRELFLAGAFPENTLATSETVTSQLFLKKKAAMQIDGSWFTGSVPENSKDTVMVMPIPAVDGGESRVIGGTSMGFYLTRKAWNNGNRRDAAVKLLAWMTSPESVSRLEYPDDESLISRSGWSMARDHEDMQTPLQDSMNKDARETWLLTCIPAVAAGTMTPEECWRLVFELSPFTK